MNRWVGGSIPASSYSSSLSVLGQDAEPQIAPVGLIHVSLQLSTIYSFSLEY